MNKVKAAVFFGIILVGMVISLFTLNKCGKRVEEPSGDDGMTQVDPVAKGEEKDPVATTKGGAKAAPQDPTNPTIPPVEEKKPAPKEFSSPTALLGALSDSVKERDAKAFLEMVGPDAATPLVQSQVHELISNEAYALDEDRPSAQIAKVAGSFSRYAIRLEKTNDEALAAKLAPSAPKIAEIYTDLAPDETAGWKVAKLGVPLEVAEFLGTDLPPVKIAGSKMPTAPDGAPGTVTPPENGNTPAGKVAQPKPAAVGDADALTIAHAFSKAIVDSDFESAKRLTDTGTITVERIAALMIAVEEGKFALRENEPLVVTLNRENIVWVLTRLDASGDLNSEFAMEMAKIDDDWKINGLAFNQLLTALANQAGAGGTAYAPMVENPQGGESLVIYFEFDDSAVSSRSNRQIEIIANILKQDPERKLRINGHADALGTDDYNRSLSDKRSAAVRNALLDFGVDPKQVITEAYGETQPLRPNFKNDGTDDPNGRSLNRRAEVYLDF